MFSIALSAIRERDNCGGTMFDPNYYIDKLKKIAEISLLKGKREKALQSVCACADLLYRYNQKYCDDDLENVLLSLSVGIDTSNIADLEIRTGKKDNIKTVLFYDGFGLDRRGIAIVTCKAIIDNGYKLIYISPEASHNKQPTLSKVLKDHDVVWCYVDTNRSFVEQIDCLIHIFEQFLPEVSFFYSKPYDVAGVVIFNALKDKTFRFQLDLTDHAFWLGLNAFDLCNGGRQYSASIQHFYRGIPLEKMCMLDANLFIDSNELGGLPFDPNDRFVFSGGQLYKTLGDDDHLFYKIIDHILENHKDIKFLYAGDGDRTEIDKIIEKYPERAFLTSERADFYRIMEKCVLYLNTYPMFGGLMMRYAALAGKLPITLKHGNDSDGILIDQPARHIDYESFDELITDLDNLLSNGDYLDKREQLLEGSVVTEEVYKRNIRLMIEQHRTEFIYKTVEKIDTTQFREEYRKRFSYKDVCEAIANKRQTLLLFHFPKEFFMSAVSKVIKRL